MPSSTLTLRQLLAKTDAHFTIPAFQRRYVWGQPHPDGASSAAYLARCLSNAAAQGCTYFLHGITMAHDAQGKLSVLVDGQQRITCIKLLLGLLGSSQQLRISYECRPDAQRWMEEPDFSATHPLEGDSQDIASFRLTIAALRQHITLDVTPDYLLDSVHFLCIELDSPAMAIAAFKMMNGAKMPMHAPELIKADLLRFMSAASPATGLDEAAAELRQRCAAEWEAWTRWWNTAERRAYYADCGSSPLDLLLRLCLRRPGSDAATRQLSHAELAHRLEAMAPGDDATRPGAKAAAARALFLQIRGAQRRFEQAYDRPETYNRIQAILLLQDADNRFAFLHDYFIEASITPDELLNCYKLSFLSMTYAEIKRGDSPAARFDDMLANLSMADIYHNDAKRDAYSLLLRLNIDEDIKLGRRFDFSIWNNRSLEHIFSKSMVWHVGPKGNILDGNDNPLPMPEHKIAKNTAYMRRDDIVNTDGVHLTEHCIGNLVLLYGRNNAEFGNAPFERKKMMFLAPGGSGVFQSRNLLHSVCVFAGNTWDAASIIDNYNRTLKDLKQYYGYL